MAGPYDYTINIPQPPAQNFLQSLLGIQQLKGLQQQNEIAQQQAAIQQQQAQFAQEKQPLELRHLEEQIKGQQLAQAGQATINEANRFALDQKKQIQSAYDAFNKDPNTGVFQLAKVAPLLDQNAREGIGNALRFTIGNQINDAAESGTPISATQFDKWANWMSLVPTAQEQQAKNAILSMPQNLQTATKGGVIGITNAAINGNRDAAIQASDDVAKALWSSNHPAAQVTAKLFDQMTNQLKDPEYDMQKYVPITALNLSASLQDKDLHSTLLSGLKERDALQKSQEKPLPASVQKQMKDYKDKADALSQESQRSLAAAENLKSLDPTFSNTWPGRETFYNLWNKITPQDEVTVRNEALANEKMTGLTATAKAEGRGINSKYVYQAATALLPDPWTNPKAAYEKLMARADMTKAEAEKAKALSEWSSTFGKDQATKDATVYGVDVKKGQSISNFEKALEDHLYAGFQEGKYPALDALAGKKPKSTTPATGSNIIDLGGGNTATFKLKK